VLSIEGFGDMVSAMWASGRVTTSCWGGKVTFPRSLGVFYTAAAQYLGFPKHGDEYKVMRLVSYGSRSTWTSSAGRILEDIFARSVALRGQRP
jgi:predicted NodU family carbamoyl transferase